MSLFLKMPHESKVENDGKEAIGLLAGNGKKRNAGEAGWPEQWKNIMMFRTSQISGTYSPA
jgi:hypothetical protein